MAAESSKSGSLFSMISLATLCFSHLLVFLSVEAIDISGGFTAELIHRDSPLSPFYIPSQTNADRFRNAYLRSISRVNHLRQNSASPQALQAPMVSTGGEYFMNISIGTPQVQLIGIADTGSDLTWIQCKPCLKCYKQKPPIFEPKKSSTFETLSCKSRFCAALDIDKSCDKKHNTCGYNYTYADGSFTRGSVGTESIAIGSTSGRPVTFPNVVFGCGNNNGGLYEEIGSGIVGLGGGPLSLISQISPTIKGKFSYCLVPVSAQANATSRINFGKTADIVPGPGVISTILVHKKSSTYYHVTLEAISVGNKRLEYFTSESTEDAVGNMIIDTGTTFTFLDPGFYEVLTKALEEKTGSKRVVDPRGYSSVCFNVKKESDLPILTVHLAGADLKLQTVNSFDRVKEEGEDVMCLNMVPSDNIAILGNLSQMNILVGYDLTKKTVSFKQTDCTKHH
ncbi:Aspartic proteinase CDR1 [Melia azedarach]|uniref:Aspartic proteinase CDR1 n=1 Tax=Melia azedarach TaxID=155640 RepID=A0ACC1YZA7_MELAZ|nr:Aspartic proteinase CDR1 [Melia azedarach]